MSCYFETCMPTLISSAPWKQWQTQRTTKHGQPFLAKVFWGCFITWPSHLFVHDLHDAVGDGHLGVNRQRVLLRESELEIGDADTKKTIAIAVD